MDYEKKYKDALERARNLHKDAIAMEDTLRAKQCVIIFPELKESEDEKIRKAITSVINFSDVCNMFYSKNNVTREQCIAWIEKQGDKDKLIQELGEYKVKYTQEILEKHINSMSKKDDERLRKTTISFLKDFAEQGYENAVECIDWLEKQGTEIKQLYIRFGDIPANENQKSKIYCGEEEIDDENGVSVYPAFELNGNVVLGLTLPITRTTLYTQQNLLEYDDRPCYLVSGDYIGKGTDGEPLIRNVSIIKRLDNYRIKEFEKQDKQKHTDKVEPKFKVDDWVVDNCGNVWKIEGILNQFYILECVEGGESRPTIEWVDKTFHLWTIKDIKDGDVLSYRDGQWIFIYKGIVIRDTFKYYALLSEKGITVNDAAFHLLTSCIIPATKEQCDLLFQKMKETGYEWDAEKKELKKIHVIDEGKAEMDYCFTKMMNGEKINPTWNKDDENILEAITYTVKHSGYSHCIGVSIEVMINWLNSLKDRVKPQWKPEDIHLEALRCVINGNNLDVIALKDLLEQLKKL